MAAGNAFLPGFIAAFNARFAVPPVRPGDLHRTFRMPPARLRDVLCQREMRYVGQQLQLSWQRKLLILERSALTETLPGKHVELFDFGDGQAEVRWNGVSLPYRTFDKDQRVTHAAIVENKRLSEALAIVREMQMRTLPTPRTRTSSERTGYGPRGRPRG